MSSLHRLPPLTGSASEAEGCRHGRLMVICPRLHSDLSAGISSQTKHTSKASYSQCLSHIHQPGRRNAISSHVTCMAKTKSMKTAHVCGTTSTSAQRSQACSGSVTSHQRPANQGNRGIRISRKEKPIQKQQLLILARGRCATPASATYEARGPPEARRNCPRH